MGYIVYFNVVKSKDIINSPYNTRQDSFADRVIRGKILDNKGSVLAETSVAEDGTETRSYPYDELYAHVVGYAEKGKSGLESTTNFNLLTSNAFFLERMMKEFKGQKNIGDNVVTTLDTNLQQAASDALGDNRGAVVVLEASTGKILSMVSKPTFNPNGISENWEELNSSDSSVLLNRVTQGAYPPGSTFKIVTTLDFIREYGSTYQDYTYQCNGETSVDGTTIHCYHNEAHGDEDLRSSFANSCNASFVTLGLQLHIDKFQETASDLLFNSKLPSVLPYKQSKFNLNKDSNSASVMMTAMGQGETLMSPYHMALITASIANGGTLMKPYLVDQITNYTGTIVKKNMPEKYGELMSAAEAAQLTEYMKAVVSEGTAQALNGQDYTVAGKTGTAEYSADKEKTHSWFVGFTNVDNPELVISVILEESDASGMRAVSVAKKVFNAYYYN
ncbi:MAG: penicillin-binding transpeptidase domain-containing protein [Lachnospiraceae bacterium]